MGRPYLQRRFERGPPGHHGAYRVRGGARRPLGLTVLPEEAAGHFASAPVQHLTVLPGGHIHRSWVVAAVSGPFLLQCLNTEVFRDVAVVHENTVRIGEHLRSRDVRSPRLLETRNGEGWWEGDDGSVWRAFEYLAGRRSAEPVETPEQAAKVGRAFGRFAAAMADLPGPPLRPTIPGFHDLPARWRHFLAAQDAAAAPVAAVAAAADALAAHAGLVTALESVPCRIAHGDAKAGNVLLDFAGAEEPVVVDLDTAGPTPLLVDAGDLIRSCTVRAAEDETDLDRVVLDEELLEAVIGGWLAPLTGALTDTEAAALIRAGQAICWEQAVRFLTDHLTGDRYYGASRPGHNLDRCRTQLRLLEQLDAGHDRLQGAVARHWPGGR